MFWHFIYLKKIVTYLQPLYHNISTPILMMRPNYLLQLSNLTKTTSFHEWQMNFLSLFQVRSRTSALSAQKLLVKARTWSLICASTLATSPSPVDSARKPFRGRWTCEDIGTPNTETLMPRQLSKYHIDTDSMMSPRHLHRLLQTNMIL